MKRYQFDPKVIAERIENWRSLSLREQLADLDRRLGVGKGAKKQRARIQAALDNPLSLKDATSKKGGTK